jgi:hypothetical protein
LGQFHVTVYVTNPRPAHLATEAMLDRTPISMSGDIDEDVEIVTGFVQSIEEDADAVPRGTARCWAILPPVIRFQPREFRPRPV